MPRMLPRAQSDVQNSHSVAATEESRAALRCLGCRCSSLERAAVDRVLPRFTRSGHADGCYPEQHNSQGIFGAELHSPRYKAAPEDPIDYRGAGTAPRRSAFLGCTFGVPRVGTIFHPVHLSGALS